MKKIEDQWVEARRKALPYCGVLGHTHVVFVEGGTFSTADASGKRALDFFYEERDAGASHIAVFEIRTPNGKRRKRPRLVKYLGDEQ